MLEWSPSEEVTVVERLGTCLQSRDTWVQIPPVTLVYVGVAERSKASVLRSDVVFTRGFEPHPA